MIDRLTTSNTIQLLERVVNFTEQRHELILENVANVSTPGYVQKDVNPRDFQQALADAATKRRQTFNGRIDPASTDTVEFVSDSSTLRLKPQPVTTTAFHDGGVRSMEQLMTNLADNAQAHNLAATMLRSRYDGISKAISMKV